MVDKMDYHIAICDDSAADLKYIANLVFDWAKASARTVELKTFPSAEAFLFYYADDKNLDILILDIEMGGMDGVKLAKEVRRDNETVQIIFITGYSDYITEGYEVSALHYLLKPVQKEKLSEVLERAAHRISKNEKTLLLEASGEMVRIPLYEIKYLEVQRNYVTLHAKRDYTFKKTLSEFETMLDDRFFRTGRSFIVNLTYVQRVTRTQIYLSDGSVIPLPRGQYEPINRAIISRL